VTHLPWPVSRCAGSQGDKVTLVNAVDHVGETSSCSLARANQIPARVTGINAGEAIANVELDANGVRLVASITVEAVRQLGLAEGGEVTAVIKASDVIIAVG
jgi:molybdopterin-binding protein